MNALDSKDDMSLVYLHQGKTMLNVAAPRVTAYINHENFIVVVKETISNDQATQEYYFIPLSKPRFSQIGNENVVGLISLEAVTTFASERGDQGPLKFFDL